MAVVPPKTGENPLIPFFVTHLLGIVCPISADVQVCLTLAESYVTYYSSTSGVFVPVNFTETDEVAEYMEYRHFERNGNYFFTYFDAEKQATVKVKEVYLQCQQDGMFNATDLNCTGKRSATRISSH
jgi:hypothetical protein